VLDENVVVVVFDIGAVTDMEVDVDDDGSFCTGSSIHPGIEDARNRTASGLSLGYSDIL
jgi:hypothetical protein